MIAHRGRWTWAGSAVGCPYVWIALLALLTALGATTAQAADPAGDMFKPAAAEPGTTIPAASVQFGMRPYADNTFYIIGIRKGWFKDVNITIEPQPEGLKVTDTNVTALLLNGQLDMISEYCPLMLPLYKTTRLLKCIAFTNNSIGETILANPKLKLKSFKDYMKEGKDFKRLCTMPWRRCRARRWSAHRN